MDTRAYANTVFDVYVDVETLLHADFKALTEEQKAALSDIVTTVGENEYLGGIVSGILNTVGNSTEIKVQSILLVSFLIVSIVVAHGQWKRENSITDIAVFTVQPLVINKSFI